MFHVTLYLNIAAVTKLEKRMHGWFGQVEREFNERKLTKPTLDINATVKNLILLYVILA